MTLLGEDFTNPWPQLRLEYVPEGSLDNQENISTTESWSILCQCLSALAYLHEHNPPIVHRDIKPANILIQQRDSESIYVKLGDFGMSKDYDDLSTICGTWGYIAPEIYGNKRYADGGGRERKNYGAAVDVWSLGVVVYELGCRLPRWDEGCKSRGTHWCEKIITKFQQDFKKRPDDLKQLLLDAMVVMPPSSRGSARDCFDQAVLLASVAEERTATPRPVSHVDESEKPTIRYRAQYSSDIDDGPQTIVWRPSVSEDDPATVPSDTGRFVRLGAPPPRSSMPRPSGFELGYPLADTTHSLLGTHPDVLGEWDQNSPSPNQPLGPLGDQPYQAPYLGQVEYDGANQEAIDAALLLQAMAQYPREFG